MTAEICHFHKAKSISKLSQLCVIHLLTLKYLQGETTLHGQLSSEISHLIMMTVIEDNNTMFTYQINISFKCPDDTSGEKTFFSKWATI